MSAIEITDGEKITKSGVFSMTLDWYHSDCCVGPSISSSGLRTIETETPAHYYATSYLNPDREEKASSGFSMGSAAHALALGDEAFNYRHVVSPFPEFRSNDAKAWRDAQTSAGMRILKRPEYELVKRMAAVLAQEPLVKGGILEGEVERSLIWQDKETGIWLKARPDTLPRDGFLVDYKTTVSASDRAIDRTMGDYFYHMQMALAAEGMVELGMSMPTTFALVFQEKTAPFAVRTVEIDLDFIFRGAQQVRRAVRMFARCVDANHWPAYEGERLLKTPKWLEDRLANQEEQQLLPKPGTAFTTTQDKAA